LFDTDQFIADCRAANADGGSKAVREVVARAVADPAAVMKALGEPTSAEVHKIYNADDLTIMPHNHEMWAVIGVYTGGEDNVFWRRIKDEDGGRIEAAGAQALRETDVVPLGKDIIHSVTNPMRRLTAAIHVYGGDFFETPRSEWDPESLCEGPYDVAKNMQLFKDANAAYGAG
jgi:predicted metal-dependent enzyme (double-stranded beta helix superfamily)